MQYDELIPDDSQCKWASLLATALGLQSPNCWGPHKQKDTTPIESALNTMVTDQHQQGTEDLKPHQASPSTLLHDDGERTTTSSTKKGRRGKGGKAMRRDRGDIEAMVMMALKVFKQ